MSSVCQKKFFRIFSKKKLVAVIFAAFLLFTASADGELVFNLHGTFGSVFSSNYNAFPVNVEYGGGLSLGYRTPFLLEFNAGFDYLILPRETETDEKLDSATVLRSNIGMGFHIPLGERFALHPSLNAGLYKLDVSERTKNSIYFGGSIALVYKMNPRVSIEVPAAVNFNKGVFSDIALSPGFTLNLSKLFHDEALVDMEIKEVKPVFPVLYSWYEKNSFASVEFKNKEEAGITNVTVSFFQKQYMTQPKICASFDRIEKDASFEADLLAFFNESMLELIEKADVQASVTVSYSVLGLEKEKTFPLTLGIYGRNAMSWEDDRRAAVFVSSKDPAAMLFARHVMSSVRSNIRSGVPLNIQYAMAIFEALDAFGLNYVIDPNSAYSDNVGSASIDFLQFPYQTLMYRGGDCDDLSILTCSLFEAVGVHTAFITIPGHIFMAFDSGVKQKDADQYFHSLDEYIVSEGKIWVPLEITLSDEGYTKAWRIGAREWNSAVKTDEAMLYKMRDSWELYRPVGIGSAQVKFELPEKKTLLARFDNSINFWIEREIAPQIKAYTEALAKKEDPGLRNDLGILYVRYGLFDEAEKHFKIARSMNNKNAVLNTAGMYFAKEQYENAAWLYRQVIDADPENTLAYLGLARCAYEAGDYETCDENYELVGQKDRSLAMEYAYLGSFELTTGRAFNLSERLEKTIWVGSNALMNVKKEPPGISQPAYKDILPLNQKKLSDSFIPSVALEYKKPEEKTVNEVNESNYSAQDIPDASSFAIKSTLDFSDQSSEFTESEEVKNDSFDNSINSKEIIPDGYPFSDIEYIVKKTQGRKVKKESAAPVIAEKKTERLIQKTPDNKDYGKVRLQKDCWYIQVASFTSAERAEKLKQEYSMYPLVIVPSGSYYRVLAGAYAEREYKIVLRMYKNLGFKDAFAKKIN